MWIGMENIKVFIGPSSIHTVYLVIPSSLLPSTHTALCILELSLIYMRCNIFIVIYRCPGDMCNVNRDDLTSSLLNRMDTLSGFGLQLCDGLFVWVAC